ncbi:MAG TPA: low affinity iron permease family protein [Candidatus Limnocylindria bacterium]|nr:low affinity iron permease family protein [Candidatus Limnocylindria bacterium]
MATSRERSEHRVSSDTKPPQSGIAHTFSRAASWASAAMGSPWAFLTAVGVILVWALTGPIFGFSSDWQLVVNTGTTIVTFLMVFLIQNTQNRDARAMHLKLDELIRAVPKARNEFMEAEEEDLDEIEREKQIVDQADPAPPEHKREERQEARANGRRANGKNGHARGTTRS